MTLRLASFIGVSTLAALAVSPGMYANQEGPRSEVDLSKAPDARPTYPQGPNTVAEFDEMFAKVNNRGRWGKDDQRGAMNLVTDAKRKQAAATVRAGLTVGLARDEAGRDPEPGGRMTIKQLMNKPGGEYMTEIYNVSGHHDSMTHIDALCHVWYKGKAYNGYALDDVFSESGCKKNGLAIHRSGIVTRGLLIDLPRLRGVPYLEPSTPVYPRDLEEWEKRTGLKVTPGDAVILRTGRWVRNAKVPEHPNTMTQLTKVGAAGFHAGVAPWFKERGVALAGQDGGAGVFPSVIPGIISPFSVMALNGLGVTLVVGMDLEEAAATAARLNRYEFLFMVAPLQVTGGTGSPVHPVAVF